MCTYKIGKVTTTEVGGCGSSELSQDMKVTAEDLTSSGLCLLGTEASFRKQNISASRQESRRNVRCLSYSKYFSTLNQQELAGLYKHCTCSTSRLWAFSEVITRCLILQKAVHSLLNPLIRGQPYHIFWGSRQKNFCKNLCSQNNLPWFFSLIEFSVVQNIPEVHTNIISEVTVDMTILKSCLILISQNLAHFFFLELTFNVKSLPHWLSKMSLQFKNKLKKNQV